MMNVVIVGGGPSGIAAACRIQEKSKLNVTILEGGCNIGVEGPFKVSSAGVRLGAQAVSFNVAEAPVASWLNRIEAAETPVIQCFNDEDLSATLERPQGWNRLTGQWRHYRLPSGFPGLLQSMMQTIKGDNVSMICDATVTSLNLLSTEKKWLVKTTNSLEYRCDALILAIPAVEASKLIDPVLDMPKRILSTVMNASMLYTSRFATLLDASTRA
jgi:predicted NAD/FAD-dependent oxidoreductase